jgi:hypothetical protein
VVGVSASTADGAPTGAYYTDTVRIPGFGTAPERCRGFDPVGFCEKGHTILGRSSCGTRSCPDHWRDWAADATAAVVYRAAAFREAAEGAEKRLSHVVVSPPQERRYTEERLYAGRAAAYEAAEAAGVCGGICITHPYRTTEVADWLFQEAAERGDLEEGVGKWRFLREHVDGWEELVDEYVEPSPHYHLLAVGEDIDGSKAPDGWVVERVRSFDRFHRFDTEAYRDMARTAYYTVTHGAVSHDRATVTYFGEMHPAVFDPSEELTAAAVDRIEREAAAVGGPGDPDETAPSECPRDGCGAEAIEVIYLREHLESEEFRRRVRGRVGGQSRWLRLRGLLAWSEGRTDNPPPSARSSEGRMLDWLEERGRVLAPKWSQMSLTSAGAAQ